MKKVYRYALYLICAVQLIFAVGFFYQLPFAVNVWPIANTSPLTFILIASFFAAAAASTLWATASHNDGALAGIGLDYFCILGPMSIYLLLLGNTAVGFIVGLGALFGLGLLGWSYSISVAPEPHLPTAVRISFIIFIIALFIVSTRLLLKTPNIMPWNVTPELSIMIGWMFFGAAIYFIYTLLKPSWRNAAGQLAGFLAYDLVLIGPLLSRLPTSAPEHRNSLIVYIIVVTYSGLLAIYYLFVNKITKVWG